MTPGLGVHVCDVISDLYVLQYDIGLEPVEEDVVGVELGVGVEDPAGHTVIKEQFISAGVINQSVIRTKRKTCVLYCTGTYTNVTLLHGTRTRRPYLSGHPVTQAVS